MLEEAAPARLVLFGAFADAKNLSIAFAVDPDRYQQRDVADFAGPTALEHDAVLAFDRPVAPCLDCSVNLLVQARHRRRRYSRAPQRLGDILDTAHRDPGQIHLDQSFFDRTLTPTVTLNNGCLECLRPKLRYLQLDVAGLGLQLALVVAGSGIASCHAALVTLRIA